MKDSNSHPNNLSRTVGQTQSDNTCLTESHSVGQTPIRGLSVRLSESPAESHSDNQKICPSETNPGPS